jgi:hypothetical protein
MDGTECNNLGHMVMQGTLGWHGGTALGNGIVALWPTAEGAPGLGDGSRRC